MKKKILYTASISLHFRAFHTPYFKWFQENGYEVNVACNSPKDIPFVDKMWNVRIFRNPFKLENYNGYKDLKSLIDNHKFELIHCHTPMASFLTRFASIKARKGGAKLLYTAHGFHFFKGAPMVNWLVYYPAEVFLSYYTDGIICLNQEDYDRISQSGSSKCNYHLIPGVGVAKNRFHPIDDSLKIKLRQEKAFATDKFIVTYSAEFISRKNHQFILEAIKKNKHKLKDVLFLFAGKGQNKEKINAQILKFELSSWVNLIGFRKDIDEIYKLSDIGVSSSKQEGLPINLVEEMMCGLPLVATNSRGNSEVVENNNNGFLIDLKNHDDFIDSILRLKNDKSLYNKFRAQSIENSKKFELSNSLKIMEKIYSQYLA